MTKKLPTIVEICGIPYSRKTTTISKMAKYLRSHKIRFRIIEEFRGDSSFYDRAKYTPDLNLVRANRCINQIITAAHDDCCDVILIDRGIFDSLCWYRWFDSQEKASPSIMKIGTAMLELVKDYTNKYHVAWLDMEPLISISHHSHQGTIVNLSTLKELREEYFSLVSEVKPAINVVKVESGNVRSDLIAERLIQQFKLESCSNKVFQGTH